MSLISPKQLSRGSLLILVNVLLVILVSIFSLLTQSVLLYQRSIAHQYGILRVYAASVSALTMASYYWDDIPTLAFDDQIPSYIKYYYKDGYYVTLTQDPAYLFKTSEYVYSISIFSPYQRILRSKYVNENDAVILSDYEILHVSLE